jgi:hypothetical protein
VPGTQVALLQTLCLLSGQRNDLLGARRQAQRPGQWRWPTTRVTYHATPHVGCLNAKAAQRLRRAALGFIEEDEQQVLGADTIVTKAAGFTVGGVEDVVGTGGEAIEAGLNACRCGTCV